MNNEKYENQIKNINKKYIYINVTKITLQDCFLLLLFLYLMLKTIVEPKNKVSPSCFHSNLQYLFLLWNVKENKVGLKQYWTPLAFIISDTMCSRRKSQVWNKVQVSQFHFWVKYHFKITGPPENMETYLNNFCLNEFKKLLRPMVNC